MLLLYSSVNLIDKEVVSTLRNKMESGVFTEAVKVYCVMRMNHLKRIFKGDNKGDNRVVEYIQCKFVNFSEQ